MYFNYKQSILIPTTAWAEVQKNMMDAKGIIVVKLVAITQSLVGSPLLPGEVKVFQ